jgi:amidohydrolase
VTGAAVPDVLARAVADDVAGRADAVVDLSHRLHADPEVAWQEERSSAAVAEMLDAAGFQVATGAYGLPTALRAEHGTGPLTVAVCAEYDALPGLGHACGHNLIAAGSVATACALAAVADELGLRVVLLGTPAEEGGGGKIVMLERGAFEGVHLAVMAHPGPLDVARADPYAVDHITVAYTGQGSHAAAYPEQGVNAADAFTVAQVAIGLLRQQLPDEVRVHGIVTRGGEVANAIPRRTEGHWYVRGRTSEQMVQAAEKVRRCFEAGALATGCELELGRSGAPYAEFRTDEPLLERYRVRAQERGRTFADPGEPAARMNRASTDMGNVSQAVAAIHPYYGIGCLPAVNHQAAFAAASATPVADEAMLEVATALALAVCDLAGDPGERERLLARTTERTTHA